MFWIMFKMVVPVHIINEEPENCYPGIFTTPSIDNIFLFSFPSHRSYLYPIICIM